MHCIKETPFSNKEWLIKACRGYFEVVHNVTLRERLIVLHWWYLIVTWNRKEKRLCSMYYFLCIDKRNQWVEVINKIKMYISTGYHPFVQKIGDGLFFFGELMSPYKIHGYIVELLIQNGESLGFWKIYCKSFLEMNGSSCLCPAAAKPQQNVQKICHCIL